jgi:hypothetical protein
MTYNDIILFLFIINLGTAFGAGIYEARIVLPLWFSKDEKGYRVNTKAMQEIETGRKFWGFVTTMPLTLLTIANLIAALQSQGAIHDWWLAAAIITLIERTGTFAFFIPTAIKLQKADTLPPSGIHGLVSLWIRLNYLRNILTLVAWASAVRALSLSV